MIGNALERGTAPTSLGIWLILVWTLALGKPLARKIFLGIMTLFILRSIWFSFGNTYFLVELLPAVLLAAPIAFSPSVRVFFSERSQDSVKRA